MTGTAKRKAMQHGMLCWYRSTAVVTQNYTIGLAANCIVLVVGHSYCGVHRWKSDWRSWRL